MEALPDEDSPPEALARYPLAPVSPFFKSFARELGGSPAEKAIKVKNLVKGRYARTRMKQLFGLTTTQIDSVLMEVKASTCWRPIIEELGGEITVDSTLHKGSVFKFKIGRKCN